MSRFKRSGEPLILWRGIAPFTPSALTGGPETDSTEGEHG